MTERRHDPIPGRILPDDEYNRTLIHNVHPPGWVNPEPRGRYNLVVLGAGTAGLVAASIAAALGARVALIERHLMGGDCLNTGCVPSKGLIRASRAWAGLRNAAEFGVGLPDGAKFDFAAAMARMRRLRARISRADSAERFQAMGVDVFIGDGRLTGPRTAAVDGKALSFSRAAICTGGRPAQPPIPGLGRAGFLTNETVFSLTALPPRLAVIGAGPIGCELAQVFARFGSRVTLIEVAGRILPRDEPEAAGLVAEQLARDGVRLRVGASVVRAETRGREKILRFAANGSPEELAVDEILVGAGRAPNVEGLGLEEAGVAYDRSAGIRVNRLLQTTRPNIYAAGDVCFPQQFTHAADALAQVLIQNALFPHPFGLGRAGTDSLLIPRCTYTDPEIAQVGLTADEAAARGLRTEAFTFPMDEVDRAILDGEERGFVRLRVFKGTDRLAGATIVAAHAGEMIGELTLAMRAGAGLRAIGGTIHPYPTQTEAIRKAANAWRKSRLTEGRRRILGRWFAWTR